MSNLGKVSFSFSKISKKPSLQVQPKEIVKKVDKIEFIDSIENNSVQVINGEEVEENKPLIIPLQHPNLLIQSVIDTVKSRTENSRSKSEDDMKENGSNENEQPEAKSGSGDQPKPDQPPKQETLEEMAARELIEAATEHSEKKTESTLTVPLANQNYDKAESTIDDYENIPVNDFGLAMLRGMGWDPKKGIGKNGQIVKVAGPSIRPKGLGLGADKSIVSQKAVGKNVSEKEVLGKGSKVRVTVGPYKNLYGTVEGFDDDAGRINVFMALSNERIYMNECFVQLVTPDEFSKYSKVININAFNNYKEKESGVTTVKHEEVETDNKSKNGQTNSPDSKYEAKDVRHASSSRSKYDKSKKYDSEDDKYSKGSRRGGSSSSRNKKSTKKCDSSSDSDSRKYEKASKTSSSKDRHRSKRYDASHDIRKDYKSKSKYESSKSKSSKKYSSDSDSSSDDRHKSKNHSKDSRRDRERRKSLSDSDDYDRRRTHKKRNRSRSRSGR